MIREMVRQSFLFIEKKHREICLTSSLPPSPLLLTPLRLRTSSPRSPKRSQITPVLGKAEPPPSFLVCSCSPIYFSPHPLLWFNRLPVGATHNRVCYPRCPLIIHHQIRRFGKSETLELLFKRGRNTFLSSSEPIKRKPR